MSKVKGTKITSKLDFVREVYGDEGEAQVKEALSEEDRVAVRRVLDVGWYPHGLYESVIEAVVRGPAKGDARVLDRLGIHSAERMAEGAYKAYYRTKDPLKVLEGMAPLHGMLNDPGEMSVEVQGEGHLAIVVTAPKGTDAVCRIARAYYQRSVELCGVGGVSVRDVACSGHTGDVCRFEVRWNA